MHELKKENTEIKKITLTNGQQKAFQKGHRNVYNAQHTVN